MLKTIFLQLLYPLKRGFSTVKLQLGLRFGLIRSLMVMPYKGFGNTEELYFMGRVLRDRGIGLSTIEDSRFRNFRKMYKRFMSWEIPFGTVSAHIGGKTHRTRCDEEGYFAFRVPYAQSPSPYPHVLSLRVQLEDKLLPSQPEVSATAYCYIPGTESRFGIISDIDDTIVPTGATRLWEMLKTTFLGNAHTRLPFGGVAPFYRALSRGHAQEPQHPFFYVSSSPWNLYDFLTEFLEAHRLPLGPLMLRDLGISREQFIAGSHEAHKLQQIDHIFSLHRELDFLLIGDSGQKDAEIYWRVAQRDPKRIKAVYIRHVKAAKTAEMETFRQRFEGLGIPFLLSETTEAAARHAAEAGWIDPAALAEISQTCRDGRA
ncbi:MAG: App1 family protein [Nitritalea sp.]